MSAATGLASVRAIRHAVDRVHCLSVVGWALGAHDSLADVSLWADGQPIPLRLTRCDRPDVLAHLGLHDPASAACGFVLQPDGSAWWRRFQRRLVDCALHVDGTPVALLQIGAKDVDLPAWAEAVAESPAGPEREFEWSRLQPFLQGDAGVLTARWAWVAAALARHSEPARGSVRHAVEQVAGLQVIGWAFDAEAASERFTVHTRGQVWPAHALRTEREDVRQALPGAGSHCGFIVDLPSSIWRDVGPVEVVWVRLAVNGQRLGETPLAVSRASVLPALSLACGRAAETAVDADRAHQAQIGYRLWLCVEHALAAGVWPAVSPRDLAIVCASLSEQDADRLREWAQPEAALPASAAEKSDAPAIWRLQRAFNAALSDTGAATLARALDSLAAVDPRPPLAVWQTFLLGLVPTFCNADALPRLRPLLEDASLEALSPHESRWELSLLLPVRVLDELPGGRLTSAVRLMRRIALPAAGGWLNTESVHDAWRRLWAATRAGAWVDADDLQAFAEATLALYEAIGGDLWSRLHDRGLIAAQCHLLQCVPWLGDACAGRVVAASLRHYALVPAFWQAWRRASPRAETWPVELAAACQRVGPGVAGGAADGPVSDADGDPLALLQWAREQGVDEVGHLQRHGLVLHRTTARRADSWLLGLSPDDALRVDLAGPRAEAAWRRLSPVPWPWSPSLQGQAWQAARTLAHLEPGQPAVEAAAWNDALTPVRRVSGAAAGFLGLALLAHALLATDAADPGHARLRDELATAMNHALGACELRPDDHPVPPWAFCAAHAVLAHRAASDDSAHIRAAADICSTRARQLWAERWSIPRPGAVKPALPTRVAGAGVLVVIRLGSTHDPKALERILAGWGATLAGRWRPWFDLCVWDTRLLADDVPAVISGLPCRRATGVLDLLAGLLADSDHGQFVLLDDDVELDVPTWLARGGVLTAHYHGLADGAGWSRLQVEDGSAWVHVDKSPRSVRFARVAHGLTVSRQAAAWAFAQRSPQDTFDPLDDERVLGHLLAAVGVELSEQGHWVHDVRPPPGETGSSMFQVLPRPGPGSPTVLALGAPSTAALPSHGAVGPPRIWPTDQAPRLHGTQGSQQLVRLRDPFASSALAEDEVGVFAVARNERLLMPHFLAHYRGLGVRRFVIADNLSFDGTREYLTTQPDVVLYSVDTPYRHSHYGVAWQLAMLAEHAQGRWSLVVDIDEFLVWPGCEGESLAAHCARLDVGGHDAALALMVDMYPEGSLDEADFERGAPFAEAPCFDAQPALPWRLGSGSYSNSPSYVSSVRHRLLPGSPPNHYTSQKVPLVRYQPWLRWSEGLHYAAGVTRAPEPLFLAHFKYHRGFRAKVEAEVARKQHYNGAEEYRKYRALWTEAHGIMFDPALSRRYVDSHSFANIPWN